MQSWNWPGNLAAKPPDCYTPTMQWDEARLTLAGVWDEKDLMPWSEASPAVHAAWLLAKAEIDLARRKGP